MLPPSSSQVMNSAVAPARYCGLDRIRGTHWASHASPVGMSQLCIESHRLGARNVKRAERSGGSASGTSWLAQSAATPVKYSAGLWRAAYCPRLMAEQLPAIDSASPRQPPGPSCEKMLGAASG